MDPIQKFFTEMGRYPGNNKQWWVAKAAADDSAAGVVAGDFLPKILDKQFSGNTKAPRGHYVVNAFRIDRSAVSGVAGLPVEEKTYRPSATAFFSGRAWWAGGSEVYYSQIIDHRSKAGLCFQEADPTSEEISDIIATDGGFIPIPEARNILKLIPNGGGMMVFAENGVWYIAGGQGGFSATDLSISKVSAIGTKNPLAITVVDDTVFWWSDVGINALEQASGQFGPIAGKFGNTNIAEQTIQTFYNNIPERSKATAKGLYDPRKNTIQWLYSDPYNPYEYNKVLNFDLTLQAFYPWEISNTVDGPRMVGAILDNSTISLDNVEETEYNTIVETRPTNIYYLTKAGSSYTFSRFNNNKFVDWETSGHPGAPYLSFIETGYELLEDAMRKKQIVRAFIYFRQTEDGTPNSVPSSCRFRTKWDWTSGADGNRWSREIEAYRFRGSPDVYGANKVVVSNNKVRGNGKSLQFRFESDDPEKNFDLLGWAVAYAGNTEP